MVQQATKCHIQRYSSDTFSEASDLLAVEEPLEIRLQYGAARLEKSLSITMRTPGADDDLIRGFLFTEGIVRQKDDIAHIRQVESNVALVVLRPDLDFEMSKLDRHFYTTSSCGVCGKSSKR